MEYKKLEEIASNFKYGKMPKKDRITSNGKYPIFSGYRCIGYYDEYNIEDNELVFVARGVGGTGDVKLAPGKCFLTNLSIAVKFNEELVNYKFLYYYFLINNLRYLDSGSAQSQITINDLKSVKVPVPSMSIQKKVVNILENLDKKIELNNQINNNLFEFGKILFKDYFDIENIEKKKLNDVCIEITRGYTKRYVEKSNIINLNQKVNKGKILEKQYFKYLDENQEIPKNRFVKKNDILLNSLGQGTLGRVHLFKENVDNIVVDQHLTIIRTDNKIINPYYLYYLLISKEYQTELEGLVTGTTGMQMLNISAIRELKIPIPMKKDMDMFEQNVKWMFEKININNLENENLIKLRDVLLIKLMNGEIELDKVEI